MRLRGHPPPIHPDALLGLVDALLTIAVTLCNAGVLSRDAVAGAFEETARQQRDGGASEARRAAVWSIAEFFKLPVRGDRHLEVIDGGRD